MTRRCLDSRKESDLHRIYRVDQGWSRGSVYGFTVTDSFKFKNKHVVFPCFPVQTPLLTQFHLLTGILQSSQTPSRQPNRWIHGTHEFCKLMGINNKKVKICHAVCWLMLWPRHNSRFSSCCRSFWWLARWSCQNLRGSKHESWIKTWEMPWWPTRFWRNLWNIMDYGPIGENKHNFHKLKGFERDEVAKSIRIVLSESMGNMIRYRLTLREQLACYSEFWFNPAALFEITNWYTFCLDGSWNCPTSSPCW